MLNISHVIFLLYKITRKNLFKCERGSFFPHNVAKGNVSGQVLVSGAASSLLLHFVFTKQNDISQGAS